MFLNDSERSRRRRRRLSKPVPSAEVLALRIGFLIVAGMVIVAAIAMLFVH